MKQQQYKSQCKATKEYKNYKKKNQKPLPDINKQS